MGVVDPGIPVAGVVAPPDEVKDESENGEDRADEDILGKGSGENVGMGNEKTWEVIGEDGVVPASSPRASASDSPLCTIE